MREEEGENRRESGPASNPWRPMPDHRASAIVPRGGGGGGRRRNARRQRSIRTAVEGEGKGRERGDDEGSRVAGWTSSVRAVRAGGWRVAGQVPRVRLSDGSGPGYQFCIKCVPP